MAGFPFIRLEFKPRFNVPLRDHQQMPFRNRKTITKSYR